MLIALSMNRRHYHHHRNEFKTGLMTFSSVLTALTMRSLARTESNTAKPVLIHSLDHISAGTTTTTTTTTNHHHHHHHHYSPPPPLTTTTTTRTKHNWTYLNSFRLANILGRQGSYLEKFGACENAKNVKNTKQSKFPRVSQFSSEKTGLSFFNVMLIAASKNIGFTMVSK